MFQSVRFVVYGALVVLGLLLIGAEGCPALPVSGQPLPVTEVLHVSPVMGGAALYGVTNSPVAVTVAVSGGVAPYTVRFDFGDGSLAATVPVDANSLMAGAAYTYAVSGLYAITATAVDATGAGVIATLSADIAVYDPG